MSRVIRRVARKVAQLDDEGNVIDVYRSVKEAAYDNYIEESTLYKALQHAFGEVKSKGLSFKYID